MVNKTFNIRQTHFSFLRTSIQIDWVKVPFIHNSKWAKTHTAVIILHRHYCLENVHRSRLFVNVEICKITALGIIHLERSRHNSSHFWTLSVGSVVDISGMIQIFQIESFSYIPPLWRISLIIRRWKPHQIEIARYSPT